MEKKHIRILTLLSIIAIILSFMITNRLFFRIDMTKDKAYTISAVSRNLHREISDTVTITYFVSDRLRYAHPLPGDISDLIREYAAHSRGRIRFVQTDPARAEITREVEALGIIPQRIQVTERNETTVATVYSGVLIEYLDREDVIPVVFSLETLEYDLTSRIRSLVRNTERVLGVIIGDAHKDWFSEYGLLARELFMSGFRVRTINPGEDIPPELPALFVLGGSEDLDINTLYYIDSYIAGGGNVLFAVDGIFVNVHNNFEARAMQDQGLMAILANYGVIVHPVMVMDHSSLNLTYQSQTWGMTTIRTVRYPPWIAVLEDSGNPFHPVTSLFSGLDLYWPSPIELVPPEGVHAEILFSSTDFSWLQTNNFLTSPEFMSFFDAEYNETAGAYILGAALSGYFPRAFSGSEAGFYLEDSPGRESRIIVIGNSHFAGSLIQFNRGGERNLDFLLRAAEWLTSDDDLLTIRSRERSPGRLDRITDRDLRDAVMTLSRTINTIIIPIGVIVAGAIIVLRRKAKTSKAKGNNSEF